MLSACSSSSIPVQFIPYSDFPHDLVQCPRRKIALVVAQKGGRVNLLGGLSVPLRAANGLTAIVTHSGLEM